MQAGEGLFAPGMCREGAGEQHLRPGLTKEALQRAAGTC